MKRLIFGLLAAACIVSCQEVIYGGGKIELSGNEFLVEKEGGTVSITTSGIGHCDISETDIPDEWVPLELYGSEPVTFDGEWYSFRSEADGTILTLDFDENTSGQDRLLILTMTDADLYGSVRITQSGK